MHRLKIANLHKETPDTMTIRFELTDEYQKNYPFLAGQYVFVQKELEGKLYKRAYSITASPYSESLQITVKETATGDFSKYVNSALQTGDYLEVSEPKGNFVLPVDAHNQKNYLGFATGSGIAPIYAMILAVLEKEPQSKFGLFYGNSTEQHTIFKKQLDALQSEFPDRFFVQYLYSQEVVQGAISGKINKALVRYAVEKKFQGIDWEQFYICGQEEMKEHVSEALLEQGVSENKIFFELFTKPKKSDKVTMTITSEGETKEIIVSKTTTILDAALDAGLDPSYSCQGGFCTSCMAKITEGQAVMEENATLNEDEIAEGKVLTCVARATTDQLNITFDV